MANVFDVASYILEKTGEISTMKLQKLCYYSQAWSLVWDDEPLFPERIEAWVNGPVVRALYAHHAREFTISELDVGDSTKLTDEQKDTIDVVCNAYGQLSGSDLSNLTHSEMPWQHARAGLGCYERGDREVLLTDMQDFYTAQRVDSE